MSFATQLKAAMTERNMNQSELSALSGIGILSGIFPGTPSVGTATGSNVENLSLKLTPVRGAASFSFFLPPATRFREPTNPPSTLFPFEVLLVFASPMLSHPYTSTEYSLINVS